MLFCSTSCAWPKKYLLFVKTKKAMRGRVVLPRAITSIKLTLPGNSKVLNQVTSRVPLSEAACSSLLKKKMSHRVMSRGPIARKKKSMVYVRLGTNRLRTYHTSLVGYNITLMFMVKLALSLSCNSVVVLRSLLA